MEFLLVLLVLATISLGVLVIVTLNKKRNAEEALIRERTAWQEWKESMERHSARLSDQIRDLSRYQGNLDAHTEAQRLLQEARTEAERLQRDAQAAAFAIGQQADAYKIQVETEIKAKWAEANVDIEKAKEEARAARAKLNQALQEAAGRQDAIVRSANQEAQRIIEQANKRAEEIAGSAYDVLRDSERYEAVATAMKHVIEGYGDQYVVPSRSLLDDLADEYGFTEAGEELKNARERSRSMVRQGMAANCDYVQTGRRETAISFVVDAFNGKVDSILSRIKADNVGTLSQEIKEAFTLVNFNGSAFRSAKVTDSYLEARLTELRWAATVQELKARDREEQRRIKEQIREEQRAQWEFERSMREAAKEEESLKKAMEKVQVQVEKASAEQRVKYEGQLAELAERLRQAEERNQRALSMAQQTKMGHVYVISNVGSFGEDVFKIGLTRRLEPLDRVKELGDASVPFPFDVHAMMFSENAPALEHSLHKHFLTAQMNKVNPRKEFFRAPIKTIRGEVEKLGINAQWTMLAEARDYRETLAIERALKEDPGKALEWLEKQADYDPDEAMTEDEGELAVTLDLDTK